MKILVVDDDRNIRKLLDFNFTTANHKVLLSRNGSDAVKKAESEKPDLILLDIMMPVMDGYEACKILKQNEATKNIPVFMLSSKSQIVDLDEAFEAGADDYIIKPFDIEKLENTINYKLKLYNERQNKQK
jgi:two-component system, OmpR family, alkaline phosphatase synthesis response regulator PhoP